MGKYSLCNECNNNTGSWYADEYTKFAISVARILHEQDTLKHGECKLIEHNDFGSLAFIKQIIAMFCSIIDIQDVKRLGFDTFLLSKENNRINTDLFDLRIYLNDIKNGSFYFGPIISYIKHNNDILCVKTAELGAYPLGFILNMTPEYEINYGTSIKKLFNTEYNSKYKFGMNI